MHVTVINPPDPIVTWDDAQAHLRLNGDDEQTYVEGLAQAALTWIGGPRGWLGYAIGQQTLEARFAAFGCRTIELPIGPVHAVTGIRYLDTSGAEQTIPEGDYSLLSDGRIHLAGGAAWPAVFDDPEAVRITFEAGEEEVAAPIKQAMLLLIGHWFANREAVNVGNIVNQMPLSVEALLSTYRSWRV